MNQNTDEHVTNSQEIQSNLFLAYQLL